MGDREIEHLIKMVNQITANLARGEDEAADVARVADHLRRFWSPAMGLKLANYLQQNQDALPRISALAVSQSFPPTSASDAG